MEKNESQTRKIMSKFLEDLREGTYVIAEIEHIDPKTEQSVLTFEKMNIVNNDSALTFIYGENASGKSFIARCFEMVARAATPKLSCRSVSVANRTSSGVEKAMIFGNESEQSTGETSVSVMQLAFRSIAKEEGKDGVVILDEPDLGLSPKFSRSLGRYVAEFILQQEDKGKGFIIISHNDTFIESVIKHYNKPYNRVGIDTELSLEEWLEDDSELSIEDLEGLKDISIAKWRGIQKAFDRKKSNK